MLSKSNDSIEEEDDDNSVSKSIFSHTSSEGDIKISNYKKALVDH